MKLKTTKVFAGFYETVYKGVLVEVEDAKRATEGELDGWYVRLNGRADDRVETKSEALEAAKFAIDNGWVTPDPRLADELSAKNF